jgi:hypothetical protein
LDGWKDGQTDRGKTVYLPPPSGSGGIKTRILTSLLKNNSELNTTNREVSSKTTLNQTQQIRTCLLKNFSESDTINRDRCSQNNFDSDTVDGDKTNSDSDFIARGRDKCPQNHSDSDITARGRCLQTKLTLI